MNGLSQSPPHKFAGRHTHSSRRLLQLGVQFRRYQNLKAMTHILILVCSYEQKRPSKSSIVDLQTQSLSKSATSKKPPPKTLDDHASFQIERENYAYGHRKTNRRQPSELKEMLRPPHRNRTPPFLPKRPENGPLRQIRSHRVRKPHRTRATQNRISQ